MILLLIRENISTDNNTDFELVVKNEYAQLEHVDFKISDHQKNSFYKNGWVIINFDNSTKLENYGYLLDVNSLVSSKSPFKPEIIELVRNYKLCKLV